MARKAAPRKVYPKELLSTVAAIQGGYKFDGTERRIWNKFSDSDKQGYLSFAVVYRLREENDRIPGFLVMQEWNKKMTADQKQVYIDMQVPTEDRGEEGEGEGSFSGTDPLPASIRSNPPMEIDSHPPDSVERWVPPKDQQNEVTTKLNEVLYDDLTWKYAHRLYHLSSKYRTAEQEGDDEQEYFHTSNCLYIGFDENQVAQARIVVKAVCRQSLEFHQEQVHLNKYLVNFTENAPNLVRHRGCAERTLTLQNGGESTELPQYWMYTYTDYCPHGDLFGIVCEYQNGYIEATEDIPGQHDQIPELFIWQVFNSIAESLFYFENGYKYGEIGPNDFQKNAWSPMVHRDLKLENIFLDSAQGILGIYPFPLLGDLDTLSVAKNVQRERNIGTDGYMAPEMLELSSKECPISVKSDVYSLGVIIYEMMYSGYGIEGLRNHLNGSTVQNSLKEGKKGVAQREPEIEPPRRYREALRSLAFQCMDVDPEERPTPEEILATCRTYLRDIIKAREWFVFDEMDQMKSFHLRFRDDAFPLRETYAAEPGEHDVHDGIENVRKKRRRTYY